MPSAWRRSCRCTRSATTSCRRASTPAACATTAWRRSSPTPEPGALRAEAYGQLDCFAAGIQFAKAEGILPAPEPTHAIKGVIEAARRAEASGKDR